MKTMPYNLSIATSTSITAALRRTKELDVIFEKNSVALSTHKKINTSYDNSALFFKDMRLSERAEGLTSVLDGLSTMVATLNSVSKSIDSILSFLDQAEAVVNSALDNKNYISEIKGSYKVNDKELMSSYTNVFDGDEFLIRTGIADEMESDIEITREMTLADLGIAKGESFNIKVGENDWIDLDVDDVDVKVSDFLGQITEKLGKDKFAVTIEDGILKINSFDKSEILLSGTAADALGFDLDTTHKITIQPGWTMEDFMREISSIEGLTASTDKDGFLTIASIYGDDLMIADLNGKTASALGIAGKADEGENSREKYAERYIDILRQIDNIVADSSYNGLNLLEGDSIRAIFDEAGLSYRTVNGVKLDSDSLGLSRDIDWQDEASIKTAFDGIQNAVFTAKQAASRFDRASYMVQSRESFLETLSETFAIGAETLTAADLDAVAVEQIAIQTERDIANQVISISMQASSNILSLF